MTAVTITDLENAKLDVDHIADVATSGALTSTDRLGNVKSTLSAAIDSIKSFTDRGTWVAFTAYAGKDLVSNSGTWYVCVVAHTSSAAFATDTASKWRIYQGMTQGELPGGGTIDQYVNDGYLVVNVDHPPYSGNLVAAWTAIDAGGKVVLKLGKRTYSLFGIGANTKPYVAFIGSGVPRYDSVAGRLIDGSGTVLQGQLYNQAAGLNVFNLGIDYGEYVRVNLAAGAYGDAFLNIGVGANAGIRYGDLIVLSTDVISGNTATYTHCILNQTGSGFKHTGTVEVIGGYHGHVIKVTDFIGETLAARYQFADAAIIKCDAGAAAGNVVIDSILIRGDTSRSSAGVLLEAQTQSLSGVTIGKIVATNADYVLTEAAATTHSIVDVNIGTIVAGAISGANGATQAVAIGAHSVGFKIGQHGFNACVKGGISVASGAANVDIGSGYSKSSTTGDGYLFNAATRHGQLYAGENAGWGVNNVSNSSLNATDIYCAANTSGGISAVPTIAPTLLNSWTNPGSFRVTRHGGMVRVSGLLSGGAIGTLNTWLAVAQLASGFPVQDEFVSCAAYSTGGDPKPVIAKITSAGEIQVYGMGGQAVLGISFGGAYVCEGNV